MPKTAWIAKRWRPLVAVVAIGVATVAIYLFSTPRTAEEALAKGRYEVAARLLEVRAVAGDKYAQNTLGTLYYLGMGVKRNHQTASRWFLASALQNNVDAQVNIARQYQNGHGVERDELRAYGWLRHARAHNSEIAENYMKWQAGSMVLVPNQMQLATERFRTLEDLKPSREKGGL